uniref:ABC-type glutathione-S-conjugate transporter n=1 Tax=Timema douglasi TaxID=61478 RepID=A0A7R8VSG4_TIMDO|nr:unnamed protein product [Timema douglasi]
MKPRSGDLVEAIDFLQDANLTWYTEHPDLTPCFQKTVLIWLPSALLWGLSPLEVFHILNSKDRDVPWNWRNVLKLALTGFIMLLFTIDFGVAARRSSQGYEVFPVDLLAPLIRVVTLALSVALQYYNRKKGLRTSGLLFLYWFFTALFGVVQFRHEIRRSRYEVSPLVVQTLDKEVMVHPDPYYPVIGYILAYISTLAVLLLHFFVDAPPTKSDYAPVENPCPIMRAPYHSRLFFSWFDPFVWKGYRSPIKNQDLWGLTPEETSREIVPSFNKYWEKTLDKASRKHTPEARFSRNSGRMDFVKTTKKTRKPSVLLALVKAFGPTFLFGSILLFCVNVLTFVSPQILKYLIAFVSSDDPMWKGYMYASMMFIAAAVQTMFNSQYSYKMMVVGIRIRVALISVIYKKALSMSNSARKESTVGEIVNLMSVDANRILEAIPNLNVLWSAPMLIALSLYFLWEIMGPSVLAGLAVMVVLIPINGFIANKVKTLQIRQMKTKDQRIKLMNEVLNGIKVLKMYAWEPSFEKIIESKRGKEIKVLKAAAYLNAGTSFIWTCAPFMVSLMTFMTFILVDSSNVLDAQTAFVSLTLFNIMRAPLAMIPMVVATMIQAMVSITRINKYLATEDLDRSSVSHEKSEKYALVMENGTFAWGDDEDPVLRNINVNVNKGSLVAIVGTVGSGKTSLVSGFLGEMNKLSGRVNTKGSIAYVPQQAWIQQSTLKDNITFGKNLDTALYDRVIEACALKSDLQILPGGDETEIGEKGINLSGGQKQRVSLARAVYRDTEVYLLDDPLSAVDSHVGKHIFENVIGPSGLLKHKTRVLVTHSITYLPEVDMVVVLKDGEISEKGTYKQLVQSKGAFSEFLDQHLQDLVADEGADENHLEEIKQQLEKSLGPEEFQRKLSRAISRVSESRSQAGSLADLTADTRSRTSSMHSMLSIVSAKSSGSMRRLNHLNSVSSRRQAGGGSQLKLNEKKDVKLAVPVPAAKVGKKLIEEEKAQVGNVKWSVYKSYIKAISFLLVSGTILFNGMSQGFSAGGNMWLTVCVGEPPRDRQRDYQSHRDKPTGALPWNIRRFRPWTRDKVRTAIPNCVFGCSGLHHTKCGLLMTFAARPRSCGWALAERWVYIISWNSDDEDQPMDLEWPLSGKLISYIHSLVKDSERFTLTRLLRQVQDGGFLRHEQMSFHLGHMKYIQLIRLVKILHNGLLRNVLRLPQSTFDTTPTGRILNRFSSDINTLDVMFPMVLRFCIPHIYRLIATLCVISYSTPIFIVVIIPVSVIYYFIQRIYVATVRQVKRIESITRAPIFSHFEETITGAPTIRAYALEELFTKESEKRVDVNQMAIFPAVVCGSWLSIRLELIGGLIVFFAALFSVLGRETMNPGLVGLSVSYALQVTMTLNLIVRTASEIETNIVAVERIKEYVELKQEAPWENPKHPVSKDWPTEGKVEFKNYQVRYREGLDLVLKGIDVTIKGGEKVGIVGRTGAGKSSLTLALFRIIEPAGGSILIDDVDISQLGLHVLRSRITIIPQDPVLFSGSLRQNLDPFDTISDEVLWKALEHAHLKAFVKGLPAGLSHEVSEGGENLSVGQRQLICLARALLRKTKVLILDEATAAVDLETDDLIQETIRREFNDCTILTIAHRLNTILDSNRVIVLDQGRVIEFDTPEALLQNNTSVFHSMAKDAGLELRMYDSSWSQGYTTRLGAKDVGLVLEAKMQDSPRNQGPFWESKAQDSYTNQVLKTRQ